MKISEEIAEILRDNIISGVYKPRERLTEEDLSDRFFVSRTPIREALKQLESAGLVKIIPYKGAFISEVDLDEIRSTYELRSVLEAFVVELAVPNITADNINQLQETMKRLETCIAEVDKLGYATEDENFHNIIFGQCPNKVALKVVQELLQKTAPFRRLSWRTTASMENSMKGHRNILASIIAGDAAASSMYAAKHIRLYLKENLTDSPQTR